MYIFFFFFFGLAINLLSLSPSYILFLLLRFLANLRPSSSSLYLNLYLSFLCVGAERVFEFILFH